MVGYATEVGSLLPALAGLAVRGLVLLAGAWLLTVALRRASAASRHLVWTAALAGVLALPVVAAVVPPLGLPVAWTGWASAISMAAEPGPAAGADRGVTDAAEGASVLSGPVVGEGMPVMAGATTAEPDGAVAGEPRLETAGATSTPLTGTVPADGGAAGWLVLLWVAGVVALLLPVAAGWLGVRRLAARSSPLDAPHVRHRATRVALRLGLHREYRLLEGPEGTMPMTWGILRPAVVLPPDAEEWPASRLEAVLLHELAHVKRRDCLVQLMAEVTRAIHWFDPLAWVAARRLRVEREHACDDLALAGGARPSEYADQLLGLAREYRASPATAMAAVAMARPGQLSDRLTAVLDEARPRRAVGVSAALRAAMVTAAAAVILSAAAPAAEAVEGADTARDGESIEGNEAVAAADDGRDGEAPVLEAGIPLVPGLVDWGEPAAPATQDPTCAAGVDSWDQVQHQIDGDRTTVQMRRRGCELEVRLEGDVEFDVPGMTVVRLGRDAMIRIEEKDGRRTRFLEIRPGAGDAPVYDYRVDGRTARFDGEAQEWYRSVLLQLFRRAGFAAEERVRAILARDGVGGVLREMDELRGGYVVARYFKELIDQVELDEGQYRTVIRQATRRVDSDHYLAEILGLIAARQPLTAGLLDDYLTSALSLDSDHYRMETLGDVIDSGRLTGAQVAAVLDAASRMDSDHYKSELLAAVADRYALEPAFRPAYLRAAAGLDSDHYRTEVLKRLLRRNDLSPQELAEVVAAATMIDSDHYRTEILGRVAELGMADPAIQQAYFRALDGIESQHYTLQALRGLIRQERLSAELLHAVLGAAESMHSDHYLSELLVDIAGRFPLEGRNRDAFLRAMDAIGSDHYRGNVADALLRAERR